LSENELLDLVRLLLTPLAIAELPKFNV